MLRLLTWLFRWACLAALLCLALAILRAGLSPLIHGGDWKIILASPLAWIAAAGCGARLALTRWRKRDPLEFLDTLEHELTHAAAGYLTFSPPISLKATLRNGGEVELPRANPVAALAPYFLPLYAGMAALLTLILRSDVLAYGRFAVVFLLGAFLYRLFREFHLGQSDFSHYGLVFSLAFIAAMLPIAVAGVLETARLRHFPWREEVWPLFLDQGRWLFQSLGALKRPG